MTQDTIARLDKTKLAEASRTALNCFRAIYDAIEAGADASDLCDSARFWPLSLLRYALGDDSEKATAEENWRDGRYVGPDGE